MYRFLIMLPHLSVEMKETQIETMPFFVVKVIRRYRDFKWRMTGPVDYYRMRAESWIELRLYNAVVKRGYRAIT